MEASRIQQQHDFLNTALSAQAFRLEALPADASFRRYFRVTTEQQCYLLMDAPPALEACHGFVAIAEDFRAHGVKTPRIYAQDLNEGLLLLEDFGDELLSQQLLRPQLTPEAATAFYHACFEPLLKIQQIQAIDQWALPVFDQDLLMQELANCREWFLEKFLTLTIDPALNACLLETFTLLQQDLQQHPQVCVHRDFHSRNLMILPDGAIGVLDFQDAVTGSISYDLVSLLRDCYVSWPLAQVHAWVADFYARLPQKATFSLAQFQQWFDWQGLQRHLKCLFIFSRKWLRDGSKNYLQDLVTTFQYVETVVYHYPAFQGIAAYLPRWREKMDRVLAQLALE